MPLVYEELRRIAGRYMRTEPAGHTLQPTALVNEAYLRLIDVDRINLENRGHFLALAVCSWTPLGPAATRSAAPG